MNANQQLTRGSITTDLPPLRQPKPETADRGTVRLGDGCITAEFPPLRQPKPEIVDRGTVRLGDGCITAEFPPLRQPKPEIAPRQVPRRRASRRVPAIAHQPTAARCGSATVASRPSSRHCDNPSPRSPTAARCGSATVASRPSSRRIVKNVDGHKDEWSARDD